MPDPQQEPSRLGEAAEGWVNLAGWLTTLVGEQVVSVARTLDSGSLDANAAAASLARSAALPLLGWAAVVDEMLDTASILTSPFHSRRTLMSDVFQASPWRGQTRDVSIGLPVTLVNGFEMQLQASAVVPMRPPDPEVEARGLVPPPEEPLSLRPNEADFVLVAVDVPPECVGVYKGQATVTLPRPDPRTGSTDLHIDVWLVVP